MPTAQKRAAQAAVMAALALVLIAPPARAHAYIESSTPVDGARLDTAPAEVRITYTEPIETRVTRLTLLDERGRPVAGTEQVSDGDMALILKLPPLPPGRYTVKSNTLGKDGHPTEETIQFVVGRSQGPEAQTLPPSAPSGDASEAYRAIRRIRIFGMAGIIVAAALVGVPALRTVRKRREHGEG